MHFYISFGVSHGIWKVVDVYVKKCGAYHCPLWCLSLPPVVPITAPCGACHCPLWCLSLPPVVAITAPWSNSTFVWLYFEKVSPYLTFVHL
jgi:hypothetical protein